MVVVAAIDIVADAIAASVKVANRLCDLSIRIRSFSALTSCYGFRTTLARARARH